MGFGRFFVVAGSILILTGILQVLVRPRREQETPFERVLNRATIWALLCVAVGLAGVLLGLGLLPGVRLKSP